MDDTCAVCAETLEWVAYGPCGHHEVCSTCVARLRCICEDQNCCICKSDSTLIFVTKALGDYTRMINDFSIFPAEPREGQVGPYWYHEDMHAYFDDLDHYKMIKAMCRLSCSICDKIEEQGNEGSKRRGKFRSIEQLKGHLYHQHKLFMCSLCLEGRKIFICEQKLYTRSQLNQHIKTGDSEVDGDETERGGFSGHPTCEFCRDPYYGENELYAHMSTEHYTCHICQRQHPGQYEYYRNYDDLEIHFRREHFLCENESCLAKKFVVFSSESEMKRHNAKEHGGHMSRAKRNVALQIPTSFQFRRPNVQNIHRRGFKFRAESSDDQISLAIQASLQTANLNSSHDTASNTPVVSDHSERGENPFDSLASTDSGPPSWYHQAAGQNSHTMPLEASFPPLPRAPPRSSQKKTKGSSKGFGKNSSEASFPPLPAAPTSSQEASKSNSEGIGRNTLAARLRGQHIGPVKIINSPQAWPGAIHQPISSSQISSNSRTMSNSGSSSSFASSSSNFVPSSANGNVPYSISSSRSSSHMGKIRNSSSSPNPVSRGSFDPSTPDFPPFTTSKENSPHGDSLPLKNEDVYVANKSLVERVRAGLEFDEDKYSAFKIISGEFRQGLIGSEEYLAYVHQFGLAHLILDLARLCPDAHKQKELINIYNCSVRTNTPSQNKVNSDNGRLQNQKSSKKGKEKSEGDGISNSMDLLLSDTVMNTVRKLQSNYRPSEEVEVLSKDDYRSKGKSKIVAVDEQTKLESGNHPVKEFRSESDSRSSGGSPKKISGSGKAVPKQRKKTSKFLRARLGDTSPAAVFDASNYEYGPPTQDEEKPEDIADSCNGLPVRGAWKNGGGQKLVALTTRKPRK